MKPTDQFAHQFLNKSVHTIHDIATTTIKRFDLFLKTFGVNTDIGRFKAILKHENPDYFFSSETEAFERRFLKEFNDTSKKAKSVKKNFPQDETEDDKFDSDMTPGQYALNFAALLSLLQLLLAKAVDNQQKMTFIEHNLEQHLKILSMPKLLSNNEMEKSDQEIDQFPLCMPSDKSSFNG